MCLDVVISTTRNRNREGTGWKVFYPDNGKLYSILFGCGIPRMEGVWLKSIDDKSESYPLGFHIFLTRAEARQWKCTDHRIRKVKFRDFLAEGKQGIKRRLCVIVAKEMLILEN